MRHSFSLAVLLVLFPLYAFALEVPPEEHTSGIVVEHGSGSDLNTRLGALAEGAVPLDGIMLKQGIIDSWMGEIERYHDRSTELRARCTEEIRRANRDTIIGKASQCMRSDLLLEVHHRRKQRDLLNTLPGVDTAVLESMRSAFDAWLDATQSVVDGIDANVFANVDTLKEAKRNLHDAYRVPMLYDFTRVRAAAAHTVLRSVAQSVLAATAEQENADTLLETAVPCLESASALLTASVATQEADPMTSFRTGVHTLRGCIAP